MSEKQNAKILTVDFGDTPWEFCIVQVNERRHVTRIVEKGMTLSEANKICPDVNGYEIRRSDLLRND